ncbi:MAG: PAAR domain-containing protein [Cyanobacteria bacterium J06638_7]
MTRPVARNGDVTSHGGVIASGSGDVIVNGRGIARVGDLHICPIHGPNAIVTGDPDVISNNRHTARVGDLTACGAVIVSGSEDTLAD